MRKRIWKRKKKLGNIKTSFSLICQNAKSRGPPASIEFIRNDLLAKLINHYITEG